LVGPRREREWRRDERVRRGRRRWRIPFIPSSKRRAFRGRCARAAVVALALGAFLPAAARGAVTEDNDTESTSQNPPHPVLRTFLGELAFLTLQGAWYWGHQEHSESEIDADSWSTWRGKLFSLRYFRFDNDHFNTNAVGHPISGLISYQIARGSGLGVGGSMLATVASSTAWKYFGESNQKLSINDLVITPASGWVLGEASYRLGSFFADGAPTLANCIGALVFSPVATLTEAPVCRGRRRDPPFDRFGLSRRTWHRLAVEVGLARAVFDGEDARTETTLGLGARIVAHAYHQRPGRGATTAKPGQWSTLGARWMLDGSSLTGASLHADTLVIGRYFREYGDVAGPSGEPDGRGLLLGLGSSFDYDGRQLPTILDRTLALGLLGPRVELEARRGRFALRATLAASYGFAMVTSLAWAQAAADFAGVVVKSELASQGYYFGQGLLTFAALEAELGDFRLRLDGRGQDLWSFNSADDHQSQIQNNFALHDTQAFLSATGALQPSGGPFRLTIELDDIVRDSRLPGTVVRSSEHRIIGAAALVF